MLLFFSCKFPFFNLQNVPLPNTTPMPPLLLNATTRTRNSWTFRLKLWLWIVKWTVESMSRHINLQTILLDTWFNNYLLCNNVKCTLFQCRLLIPKFSGSHCIHLWANRCCIYVTSPLKANGISSKNMFRGLNMWKCPCPSLQDKHCVYSFFFDFIK